MNPKLGTAGKVWNIAYPILMYYVAITMGSFAAQIFFGSGIESYMLCKIVGSFTAIPVVYADYKQDLIFIGKFGEKESMTKETWIALGKVLLITLLFSISLNNIISMSPLVSISEEYQTASNAFYSSTIWVELFGSALVTPFLEELLHRGVVYGRLRRMMGTKASVLLSALLFAGLHFNLVQFIYAFLMGILFALFVEKTGKLYPAIFAHIIANGVAIIRTETGFLNETVDGSLFAWIVSLVLLIVGVWVLEMERYNERK